MFTLKLKLALLYHVDAIRDDPLPVSRARGSVVVVDQV
jgi:hypothetical protein